MTILHFCPVADWEAARAAVVAAHPLRPGPDGLFTVAPEVGG